MSKPLMMQKVSPVERARQPLEEIPMRNAIEQLVGGSIESCSDFAKSVVGQRLVRPNDDLSAAERFRHLVRSKGLVHPFVGAVQQAYADHRPTTTDTPSGSDSKLHNLPTNKSGAISL